MKEVSHDAHGYPLQISELFDIPTICQKLTLHGAELQDNEATAESLQLLANDIIELQQITEEIDIDNMSDSGSTRSRPRTQERGFNGTLLGGASGLTDVSVPSSRAASVDAMAVEKACKVCTYANDPSSVACEICDTVLE